MVTESNAGMVSSTLADCSSRPLTDPAVTLKALLFSAVCDSGPPGGPHLSLPRRPLRVPLPPFVDAPHCIAAAIIRLMTRGGRRFYPLTSAHPRPLIRLPIRTHSSGPIFTFLPSAGATTLH
jgi:hypothetical protein